MKKAEIRITLRLPTRVSPTSPIFSLQNTTKWVWRSTTNTSLVVGSNHIFTLTEQQLHQWRCQKIHSTEDLLPAIQFLDWWHKVVGELLLPIETEHKSHQLTVKRHHTTYIYSEKEQKSQDVCNCKKHPFEGKTDYLDKSRKTCWHNSKSIPSIKSWSTPLKRIGNPNPEFEKKHEDWNSDLRVLRKKDSLEVHQAKDISIRHNYNIHSSFKKKVKRSSYFKQGVQSSRW